MLSEPVELRLETDQRLAGRDRTISQSTSESDSCESESDVSRFLEYEVGEEGVSMPAIHWRMPWVGLAGSFA